MLLYPGLHLSYCTNIHPGHGWQEVEANLHRVAPGLKARLSPSAPFGIGLRLSAPEATELLQDDRLDRFRAFLDREGLYVALINGFPYGAFHGAPVKTAVYAPDWREPARLDYTLNLISILQRLLPAGMDGGISTSPLSYKPWMTSSDPEEWNLITEHVVRVAEALVKAREKTGAFIHLQDTVRCIELAVENAPERGERVRIFNQMTEVHRVIDLAELVARLTGAEVDMVGNPRKEADENDLDVENTRLLDLGLDPITLEEDLLVEVTEIAERYMHRCDREKIPCRSLWVKPSARGAAEPAGAVD